MEALNLSFSPQGSGVSALSPVSSSAGPAGAPFPAGDSWLAGLRDYQREGCLAVVDKLRGHQSTLLIMATGLGKTITASALVRGWRGGVLWLAHRSELLEQARAELERLTGEDVSIEQAQRRGGGTRIIVGSVQTLRGKRLELWKRDRFSLVVCDEAHHAVAKTYRAIFERFSGAKRLGLTATPDRGDGAAMGRAFESVAIRRDIDFGIANGYLVPVELVSQHVDGLDFSGVHSIGGDLAQDEVEKEIVKVVAPIAQAVTGVGDKCRRTLTFTPRVHSAHAVAAAICEAQPANAVAIDGKTLAVVRGEHLRRHKASEYQHLVNCMVFTEGYDDAGISVGVIARPTKSRGLYVQMLGRILRPLPGIGELATVDERRAAIAASAKPRATIVDICGNAGKHSLVSPLDVLGGGYDDRERALAKKIVKEEKRKDVGEALEEARKRLRDMDAGRMARVAKAAARAAVKWGKRQVIDPLAMFANRDDGPQPNWAFEPAAPHQLEQMRQYGIDVPPACPRGKATKLLLEASRRRRLGLCSYKQVKFLSKYHIPALQMRVGEASRLFVAIKANKWRPLSREQMASISARAVPEYEVGI